MILPDTPASNVTHGKKSMSQNSTSQDIPADILIIVLEILLVSNSQTELYIPLICSHVCAHWHQTIAHSPSLWSYVDTSRGEELTRLWLSRSKTVAIDVRLWENPLDCDLMQGIDHLTQSIATTSRIESTIESVKAESYRWRSLDIAFCDMRRITQILEFLGRRPGGTLHLDSLTIGPMGSTTLNSHEFFGEAPIGGDAAAFPDITAAQSSFEKLNVSCDALRIDTYPIATSSDLFSSRLTVLEAFVGGYGGYDIDFSQWERILLQTRNLVHLRLKNFKCSHRILIRSTRVDVFELPILEKLELSGEFAWFIEYLGEVSFPKLESLALNSFNMPHVVNNALVSIVSVSPLIRRLSICTGNNNWDTVRRGLHLLQEVTLLEMRWDNVIAVLTWLVELPGLLHVRLEHIWDMDMADPRFEALYPRLPPIELVDSFAGGRSDCRCSSDLETCASEDQSNYSDNSSFSGTSHSSGVFPPSEETGSDESERSYGEDENLGFAGPVRNWDV